MRMKKFVQTASYLPYFISWVIAANIFLTFLSGDGVVNDILQFLHFTDEDILFFQKGPYFWWIIAIANTWKVMGYNAIIYLAAISGIDQEQYEAAEVDGANALKQWWYITIPQMTSCFAFLFITSIINGLARFSDLFIIGGNTSAGRPGGTLQTILMYIYQFSFESPQYGIASAGAMILFVLTFVITLINLKMTGFFKKKEA